MPNTTVCPVRVELPGPQRPLEGTVGATSDSTTELYPRAMTQCACSSRSDCYPRIPPLALYPCTNRRSNPWPLFYPAEPACQDLLLGRFFPTPDRGMPSGLTTAEGASSDITTPRALNFLLASGSSSESLGTPLLSVVHRIYPFFNVITSTERDCLPMSTAACPERPRSHLPEITTRGNLATGVVIAYR